ncbi:MAG: ATP-binding protein [Acidimicrobiaceae bacterium]|nr:ATP-binding protein [Acidimicrobiaceae bacterium]
MTALLAILAAVVAAAVGAIVAGIRQRRRVNQHLDRIANRVSGVVAPASKSPVAAVERLETVLEATDAERQLRGAERRYEAALEAIDMGVVVVDENGSAVFCNTSASWYREGRHSEAVIAQKIDDLIHSAVRGERVEQSVVLYGPPRRALFVSALPIHTEDELVGAIALIHDVTEVEQANAIRRDFVANISHELRTPIGAVSLLAETLIGEHDPEVIDSLAHRLLVEAGRLTSTVQDLLELSRIEHSGDSEFSAVAVQGVVGGAHDRARAAAAQRGVAITVDAPELDLQVRGDRRQLTSAMFNLLDNAIKFSDPEGGSVSVGVREAHGRVEVEVADSGIGIPRQDLERIFERFYRVDRGRSRTTGGIGLGLSMVRHIVANHGGRVSVDSTEGEGATFTMDLPLIPDSPGVGAAQTSAAPAAPGESTAQASAAPVAPGKNTAPGGNSPP